MPTLKHVLATLALLALAGCAGIRMGPTVAAPEYAASPKRIFVLNGLDERFSNTMPDSFTAALTELLAGCGIATAGHRPAELQLNVAATIQGQLDSFRADAVLSVRQTERVYHEGNVVRAGYVATLADVGLKREVWKAEFTTYGGVFADKSPLGRQLAGNIVRQLGLGNIVKSCPSLPAAS
jgi:hypothetical protein